ncbi:hypothetical protein B0H12DRAFT_1141185 [Mycena haematopus]|nr:hypothetical protein B0H12DRAFT_1141185 [Mycena haematopus]
MQSSHIRRPRRQMTYPSVWNASSLYMPHLGPKLSPSQLSFPQKKTQPGFLRRSQVTRTTREQPGTRTVPFWRAGREAQQCGSCTVRLRKG